MIIIFWHLSWECHQGLHKNITHQKHQAKNAECNAYSVFLEGLDHTSVGEFTDRETEMVKKHHLPDKLC